jgi:hypothetical protein
MNEDKGTFAERNIAKRLENEAAYLKRGYLRGSLLPAATFTVAFIICAYAVRHFCINGTFLDRQRPSGDRDAYYDARRDYYDGNFDSAATLAFQILTKQPSHAEANQLMARIALARGNRKAALSYLRRSLDTSLDREEVAKWISALETSEPK